MAITFLISASKFGIAEYEKKFVALFSKRVANKALELRSDFLKSELKEAASCSGGL